MNLLPQMRPEYLDERDLEGRNLSVHENPSQIELDLESHVNIRTIDCRRPPQGKATVRDLVQT